MVNTLQKKTISGHLDAFYKKRKFFYEAGYFFRIFQILLKMRYFPKKIQFCYDFFYKPSLLKPNKHRNTHNWV